MAQQVLCAFGLLCSGNINYGSNLFGISNHNDDNNNYEHNRYPVTTSLSNLDSSCPYFDYTSNYGTTEGRINLPSQRDASIILRVELSVASRLSVSNGFNIIDFRYFMNFNVVWVFTENSSDATYIKTCC